jgi:hypothetical protein
MTAHHSEAQWRHIATATAIFSVAVSVAAVVATPVAAKPKDPGQRDNFLNCFWAGWNKNPYMGASAKQNLAEDCCLNAGGIYNETAHTCYLGVDNITVDVPNPTPPPPTRATIAPPPGATDLN